MLDPLYRPDPHTPELVLTRDYRQPPEKLWAALTIPEKFAAWMDVDWKGDAEVREGADFSYRFRNTDLLAAGHVLRLDPGRLLEHSWFEGVEGGEAAIRWELTPNADGGTRLTLTHVYRSPDDSARTGAGWTMILDQLAKSLGDESDPDLAGGWPALRDRYKRMLPYDALRDGVAQKVGEEGATLTYVRKIARPVDAVWTAVSTAQGVGAWMIADATIDDHVGGRFILRFRGMTHVMTGEITAFEPGRRIAFTWPEADAGKGSDVEVRLEPDGPDATKLTLVHAVRERVSLTGFAMGWHWHLDQVEKAVDGADIHRQPARERALTAMYEMTLPFGVPEGAGSKAA